MTPVWTLPFSSVSVSTVQQQDELRWVTQLTEKGETAIKIYDLADGQTYTRAIEWDKVEGWNAGYPEKLLANDTALKYLKISYTSAAKDAEELDTAHLKEFTAPAP